jgi:hypothetical protein
VPFLSIQAAAQLLSVIAGLVVVRRLPVSEFAIYTLATAIQGVFSVLTDAGVSTVLVAQAGTVHSDRNRLAELVASARQVRRRLEAIVLTILAPVVWLWLRDKGLTLPSIFAIAALLAFTLHFQITASIYSAVPLVLLEVGPTQQAQLFGSSTRLILVYAAVSVSPWAVPVLAANAVATAFQALLSRYFAGRRLDLRANSSREDLNTIGRLVKSQIVNSIYFAFSSQVTVWLVGLTGSRSSIAAVGALGRLGTLVVAGQTVLAMLVVPRLARMTNFALFLRRSAQVLCGTLLACLLIWVASVLAPGKFLWLLGVQYSNLNSELPLAIGSALTFVVVATIQSINNSKAWIERAWIVAPMMIGAQAISVFAFNVATPRGAILVGWISLLPGLAVNATISISKLRAWQREVPTA